MNLKDVRPSKNFEIDELLSNLMRQHDSMRQFGMTDDGTSMNVPTPVPRPAWAPPREYHPITSVPEFLYKKLMSDRRYGNPF